MFDSNLEMRSINNDTAFREVFVFANMNNDENYGFYKPLDLSNSPNITLAHIGRNSIKYFAVDRYNKIKDFFGYTSEAQINNIKRVCNYSIRMNFNNFNINDDDLVPIRRRKLNIDNKDVIIAKDNFINDIVVLYNIGYKIGDNSCYMICEHYNSHSFHSYYNIKSLKGIFPPRRYTLYKLKDNVDMNFTIEKGIDNYV